MIATPERPGISSDIVCHTEACILPLAESWLGERSGMTWTLKMNSGSFTVTLLISWRPRTQLTISHSSLLFCCTLLHSLHLASWFANFLPCIAFPLCHCVAFGLSSLLLHPQPHNQQRKARVHFLSDWWEQLINVSHPFCPPCSYILNTVSSGDLDLLVRWSLVALITGTELYFKTQRI